MNLPKLNLSLISCASVRFGIILFLCTLVLVDMAGCSSTQPTTTPLLLVATEVDANTPEPDGPPSSQVDEPTETTSTPTPVPTVSIDRDAVNAPTPVTFTATPRPDIPDPATSTPTPIPTPTPTPVPAVVEAENVTPSPNALPCGSWPVCDAEFWSVADAGHVDELMESGVDVNAVDPSDGGTALHFATLNGKSPTAIEALLAAGADPNALTDFKYAPLHYAALRRDGVELVNALIEGGAEVDIAGANLVRDFEYWKTPLHVAASRNSNPDVVRALVEAGADVNARDADLNTPLHDAAESSHHPSMIDMLLGLGAEIDARNEYDDTPLHEAAEKNDNVEITIALISAGADINAIGFLGSAVLNDAARNENLNVLVAVIDAGVDVSPSSSGTHDTPLHTVAAALNSDPALIAILLNAGIDVNAPGIWDRTPLHEAAYYNQPLVFILALIDAGADINAKDFELLTPCQLSLGSTFSAFDNDNATAVQDLICEPDVRTPQQFAEMISTDPEVIDFLIQGWDDNELTPGQSPLHYAAESSKDRNAIDRLLEAGIEPNPRDFSDWTPLHVAARNNPNADVLRALIEGGADVNAKEGFRRTPLKMAIENNPDLFVIIALLEGGADIFYTGDDGRTACESLPDVANRQVLANVLCIESLHDAAEFGLNATVISQLIEIDADPNGLDQEGLTPLHLAAFNPRPEILEALISAGARVDSRIRNSSFNEETPLHVAMAFNTNPAVVDALILAGAKVNARTSGQDRTPLHYAVIFNELPYVIPTLVEHGANLDAADYTGSTPCDYFDRSSLPAESRNLVCR